MKKLNCDFFQMTMEFDEKLFKKKEFVLDVKPKKKTDKTFFFSFGSKNTKLKEHAHFILNLSKDKSVLRITYHQDRIEDEDVREPYFEDFTEWLANFFTETEFITNVMAVYKFSRQYESVIQLNYPLLIGNDLFKGATISGHEIDFPFESIIDKAVMSTNKDSLLIFLYARVEIDLASFGFYESIENLSKYTNALVKKKEGKNERNRKLKN